jgi:hypothetical protein
LGGDPGHPEDALRNLSTFSHLQTILKACRQAGRG